LDELLATTEKDVVAFAKLLIELMPESSLCIAGSQQIIYKAQEQSKESEKGALFEIISQVN
jgi:hypothetical protein